VFTARYALSPYIKQIRFVFKRLMSKIRARRILKTQVKTTSQISLYGMICMKHDSEVIFVRLFLVFLSVFRARILDFNNTVLTLSYADSDVRHNYVSPP
jgi:hypothetical protein